MLHSLRRRQAEHSEREAAGESLWTPLFDDRVRMRIRHAFNRFQPVVLGVPLFAYESVRGSILEQEGLWFLHTYGANAESDLMGYFQSCSDEMFPTVLEGIVRELDTNGFALEVNEIFLQERVGWELVGGEMVEIHSKELHEAVVEPALRLLHEGRFRGADKAYRDALHVLAEGKASDAITDAGTALQEMLTALGCEGNQLGDLIRSARQKRLIAAHDDPLAQAIIRLMNWVAADRSQMGDSHRASDANIDDAWLSVHVVGALMVRLASGQPRG